MSELPQAPQDMTNQSNAIMTSFLRAAEIAWGDTMTTSTGPALLNHGDIPLPERVKTAFCYGHVSASLSLHSEFIANGMEDFFLPNRKVAWQLADKLDLKEGETSDQLAIVARIHGDAYMVVAGYAHMPPLSKELFGDTPRPPSLFRATGTGNYVHDVMAYVPMAELLKTFLHAP